ncbi:trifunctional serine/threonine-protein kinase/ATP-binding protein/sensor histidine kinase [Dapis sp. BLCC M126]|uniref:trifunctional serine/threonine-protein kinase/ATP-binding protein/sensor histidine kinase n=1 Tax=Dapis sp. BLCC M126 TaxID=3400189 RepID=UPI003CF1741F
MKLQKQRIKFSGILHSCSLKKLENPYAFVVEDSEIISLKEWWYQRYKDSKNTYFQGFDCLTDFLPIAVQIAQILHKLHYYQIIYQHIKPSNILIDPVSKQVNFSDFTFASIVNQKKQVINISNVLEGTLGYISPEQTGRMNRCLDYRTDFYSLGITFYQLLTMQLPFSAEDPMEWIYCHLAKNPPAVHEENPKIPQVLSNIVAKLMAKNPEDRYQSALGLKQDLEKCLSQWEKIGQIDFFELGKNDICDRFMIPDKLYGRDLEVKTLLNAFDRSSRGNREILLIAGESGVGKTAVIQEIHKPVIHQKGYFIQGKFDQFQRNIPYSAILQAFRSLMKQLLTENSTRLNQWKSKIIKALGDNSQVIIDVIPELEEIIGSQPAVPELNGTANQNRFNLLFQKFTQVFASQEHPLVIFLDDLQWIDSSSLQLIQLLMGETEIHHLLLIGAYRDNEVSSVHPLIITLKEIQNLGITINTIQLKPLQLSDLNDCIQETLHCSQELAEPITQLIYQKTQGNPFFSHQFMLSLYEDKLIRFNTDVDVGFWEYDLNQIQTLSLTEDVVEFMVLQLKKLPLETQNFLKLAACIGNEFDLSDLAIVSQQSQIQTANALKAAFQQGLILKQNQGNNFYQAVNFERIEKSAANEQVNLSWNSYKFLHDRVQQAAYSLIPQSQQPILHQRIGKLLLSQLSEVEQESKIFDIVNHLNISISTIKVESEYEQLIQLNLKAARKARATTAYDIALEYATTAIQLLPSQAWQYRYLSTLELYEIAIEITSLLGDFEQMEALMDIILEQAKTPLDLVKAYEVKIQACASQNKMLEAIVTARQVLKLFNVEFPESIKPADIEEAMMATAAKLSDKTLEEIVNLPVMTDKNQLAIGRIILSMIPATFIAEPALFPLIVSSQVKASLDFGNSPASSFFYATYGLFLAGNLQDFETSNWLGKLCLDLTTKLEDKDLNSRTYLVLGSFIFHTQSHLKETLPLLQEGYQIALEVGNLEFVGYFAKNISRNSYWIGNNLIDLATEIHTYQNLLSGYKQVTTLGYCQILGQTVSQLLGESESENLDRLLENGFDGDTETLYQQLTNAQDMLGLFYLYLDRLILCYLFGKISQAREYAIQIRQYLDGATGLVCLPIFYFYDSLITLAFCTQTASELGQYQQQIQQNQDKLCKWAESAPMNHQHKFYLVEAEKYRILGDKIQAAEMYDHAITLAQENQFINEVALANELAAKFYLNWGKERIAEEYLIDAYSAYACWGAMAKVQALEETYPFLNKLTSDAIAYNTASNRISPTFSSSASSSITENLDFTTVLKASQALAQEIHLEQLLEKLINIIVENAGAEKCILAFYREENLVIEAVRNSNGSQSILQCSLLKDSQDVPQSIVNYVSRTKEILMIEDACKDTTFAIDAYLVKHQPKSVLCLPINHRNKLIGIIYLENNLMPGAFTNNHLDVLNLLSTQIAISLENAMLYGNLAAANQNLEDKVEQRTQQLNQKNEEITEQNHVLQETLVQLKQTQAQLIQAEKMSSLGQMVAGIAHEINNPVSFIHGNIEYASQYVQDLFNLIDTVQECFPVLPEEVQTIIEEIDLDFLQKDLVKLFGSMEVGTRRIREIVGSLRNFSRLDESDWKEVDIHQGIESTLLILKNRLKPNENHPEITVIKDYGQLPLVNCYAGQLNQVFMNILNNAIDALLSNEDDGKLPTAQPEIRIHTVLHENSISIQITDNGPGIKQKVLSKVFDPFFTTKPVGQGKGLGLSVSYQIVVERHGGCLTCQSAPGQGAKFVVDIPIY